MEEKIVELLGKVKPEILEYEGIDMLGEGVIDSFDIIDIMTELEEAFDMEIDAEHAIAENFRNKESIIEMMTKIL